MSWLEMGRNQHAADENLRLQNLWDGIEIFAALFSGLAAK